MEQGYWRVSVSIWLIPPAWRKVCADDMKSNDYELLCPACNFVGTAKFRYFKNGIAIVECPSCGLGKACPTSFDSHAYYDASYFNGGRPDGYADYTGARAVLQDQFRGELDLLQHIGSGNGRLLEIGSAFGYFLEIAKDRYEVFGLELCEEAVADCHSRGLDSVRQGAVSPAMVQQFPVVDVLVFLDVIEHLPEPKEELTAALSRLKPGGLLLLTTGDYSSLVARVMGRNWRLMTPPQHLWFFTPRSLKCLGDELGLEVVHIDYPSKKVPLGLVAYQLARYFSFQPRIPHWLHKIGLRLNMFDAMRVVLRKSCP